MKPRMIRLLSLGVILAGAASLGTPKAAMARPAAAACGGYGVACVYDCSFYTQKGGDFQCAVQNGNFDPYCCSDAMYCASTSYCYYDTIVCQFYPYGPRYCPVLN